MYLKFLNILTLSFIVSFLILTETSFASPNNIDRIPLKKVSESKENYREGEIIVKYKNKEKLNQKIEKINKSELRRNLSKIKKEIKNTKLALIKSESKKTKDLMIEFGNDENIEIVEPNYFREFSFSPNDTYFSSYQWAHENTGQNILGVTGSIDADSDIAESWDIEESGSNETIVAILDSGVRHSHTDLSSNMWDGTVCVDENNTPIPAGCPNHGWDYENSDNDPDDIDGHGTHVASIIGSTTNNSSGIAGISRYNKIKTMALRFDLGVFSEIDAINFAKNNGAKVINGSFSGSGYSALEKNAIENFDGIFVAAAGNGGADNIGDNNETKPQYPCNYTSTNIICVAATDQNDNITSFSNYGTTSVDLAAPGKNIIGYSYTGTGGWDYYLGDGTSFAAPFVSGTVALLYSQNPTASVSTIRSALLNGADKKSSLSEKTSCSRRLNMETSLQAIIDGVTLSDSCPLPIYRFYSRKYQSHLYTSSESEKNNIIANWPTDIWEYQRIEFLGYNASESGVSPVYRFWSRKYRTVYYTTSIVERDNIVANWPTDTWEYQGIRLYAHLSSAANRVPVYRFWSKKYKASYFTTNINQRTCMENKYPDDIWRYEEISWWMPEEGLDSSPIDRC